MAKLSLYATLLLLCTSGTMMGMVAGDMCKQDIGACTADCNTSCANSFQGGFGECLDINGVNDCWCYYGCTPPKICSGSTGDIGACDNTQCDLDCGHKFPGKGATGICYSIGDPMYDTCQCRYYC